jgi:hypothetical protein
MHFLDLTDLSEHELAACDIGLVHLTCAAGLPGSQTIEIPVSLAALNNWAKLVKLGTHRTASHFHQHPEEYDNSPAVFRMMVLCTILQRDIGIGYNPALRDDLDGIWPNSADRFIHGVIQNRTGTCASLPPFYAAIGRRLAYPLKLVTASGHLFVRWEGQGERFNIECTSQGLVCPPDEHYLTGRYAAPPSIIEAGGFLKSLTPKEELAGFLANRAFCWLANGEYAEAADCFALASRLGPSNHLHAEWFKEVMQRC